MLNISPIGRNCSRPERNDYEKFDLENNIRKNMVEAMKKDFGKEKPVLETTNTVDESPLTQLTFRCYLEKLTWT